jgi:hypothetical protein
VLSVPYGQGSSAAVSLAHLGECTVSLDRIAALRRHIAHLNALVDYQFHEDAFDADLAGHAAGTWWYLLGKTLGQLEVDVLRLERDVLQVEIAGGKPVLQQEVEDWLVQALLHRWRQWQRIPDARPTIADLLSYVPTEADVACATGQSRTTIWRRLGHATPFATLRAARLDAARERAVAQLVDRGHRGAAWICADMATRSPSVLPASGTARHVADTLAVAQAYSVQR